MASKMVTWRKLSPHKLVWGNELGPSSILSEERSLHIPMLKEKLGGREGGRVRERIKIIIALFSSLFIQVLINLTKQSY